MDEYPEDNTGSAKGFSTGRKDGNGGVLIKDSAPPIMLYRLEDRSRSRKKKVPTVAKATENKNDEAEKSLKNGPKGYIKATKSRLLEGMKEGAINDPSSYSLGVITWEEQAAKEPDFIGGAFFYNLSQSVVRVPSHHLA